MASNAAKDEDQIRELISARTRAVLSKDVAAATSSHSPDITMFDAVNPLRYSGVEAVRTRTRDWFSLYDGPIGYEVRDLVIVTGDDVAFSHYLYRVTGTTKDGGQVRMWVRATLCFRRGSDTWVLVHEHDSVPFDPTSGRASLDLVP